MSNGISNLSTIMRTRKISVIIPARNERANLTRLLPELLGMEGIHEIIVADGQSDPGYEPPEMTGVTVLSTKKGRAIQMNMAARFASGDILWFLHADSIPDPGAGKAMRSAISRGALGGCFSLFFYDADSALLRYIARNSNRRAKHLRLIFGDQGLFARRSVFVRLNGFQEIPIMEDWDFSIRLHRAGKVSVLKAPIGTSARRLVEGGTLRTLLYMHSLKIRYILGVPPEKLAKNYREAKK